LCTVGVALVITTFTSKRSSAFTVTEPLPEQECCPEFIVQVRDLSMRSEVAVKEPVDVILVPDRSV